MSPSSWPVVTASNRLVSRSNPRPSGFSANPTTGSPRSRSWATRRRLAASASTNQRRPSASPSPGRVRVSAQLRHSVPAALDGTTQLQLATARLAHGTHVAGPPGAPPPAMGEDGGTIVNEPGSNPSAVPQVRQRSFSKYTRAWQVGQWSERMRLLFPCSPARNTTDTTVQHHVRVSQSPEVVASTGADAWNRIIEPPIEPPSTQMPNPAGSPWLGYAAPGWDEMLGPDAPRPGCAGVMGYLDQLGDELHDRQEAAELAIASMGISFTVYAEKGNIDRAWPFDVIPRVIDLREWEQVSKGLIQRLRALNLFIGDLYGEARVLADGIVPAEIVKGSPELPARVHRHPAAAGHVGPHQRQRPRAGRRRRVPGAGGQPPGAVRRVVHAREPADLQAGLRRRLPQPRHPARRRVPRPGSRRCWRR